MSMREILLAICVPLTWSLGFTFSKLGLTEFPPLMLMGMRFCLTALILVFFVARPTGHYWDVFWIAVVSATLQYGLTFYGLSMIDASMAIIIVQLEVPFGVLAAIVLLRERPGLARVVGIALAFTGVVFIAGEPNVGPGQWLGIALTGSGALVWSFGQIMVKRLGGAVGGFSLIAWVGVFSGPQMLIASLFIETGHLEAIRSATWIGWGTVLYLAVIMTALGYGIWYSVLSRNPVSSVMPVLLLLPVFVIIESIVLLGERPEFIVLLGGGIVLEGVAVIILADIKFKNRRASRPARA